MLSKRRVVLSFVCFFVFLLISNLSNGQLIVEGELKDTNGKPIGYVQVILKRGIDKPAISFTQANSKGYYQISIKEYGSYTIAYRSIAHKVHFENIEYAAFNNEKERITKSVVLESQSIYIDEVIVRDQSPVTIKVDTVIYQVDAFKKGDEEVAEDVLKQLPGIEVDDDGKIKFQGKLVSKVTVDGDDMFDKGYQLLTKGLDASMIDKVEALSNQTENEKLKGVDRGDETILNLVLKDNAKLDLYGNASIYGTDSKLHDASLKLMSFSKKFKLYAIGSSNDMGVDPLGNIREFYNVISFQKDKDVNPVEVQYRDVLDLKGHRPKLDDGFTAFNNSRIASFNTIFKPSEKLKVKLVSFAMDDEQQYFHSSKSSYVLSDTVFSNMEIYRLSNRQKSAYGSVKITWDINARSNLIYDGNVSVSSKNADATFNFNDSIDSESVDNEQFASHHEIEYTSRFAKKQAFLFSAKFDLINSPQSYSTNKYRFGNIVQNIERQSSVFQRFRHKDYGVLIRAKYLMHPNKNMWFNAVSGYQEVKTNLYSVLAINNSAVLGNSTFPLLNDRLINYKIVYGGVNMKCKFRKFEANVKINYNLLINTLQDTSVINYKNKLNPYFVPAVGIKWEINKFNKVNLLYVYNMNPLLPSDDLSGFYVAGYNTLRSKSSAFGLSKNHNAMLMYNLGNFSRGKLLNLSLIYNYTEKGLVSNRLVEPEFSVSNSIFDYGSEMILVSSYVQWFIDKIYHGLKFKLNVSHTKSPYYLNHAKSISKYLSYRPNVEFKSTFLKWFNYEAGVSYIQTEYLGKSIKTLREQSEYLDFIFNFSKRFKLKIIGEHYCFHNYSRENRNWYFLNVTTSFQIIPEKLKLTLQGFNLFNETKFGDVSITEISSSESVYRLRGRYIMCGAFYRF